ncbi:hypothetical protein FS749_001071 [Ceratobasidium sp. UAMH 11750]|nr:hypothetical protein FS749_001071 [Ceratobasidium sp. UAMH 11750]
MDGYIQMALTEPTKPTVFLADPQAIKEINRPRSGVVQAVEISEPFFGMFGPNVATLEGDTWKHHRRITQRAFTEKNVQLVWSETVLATEQLFKLWDERYGDTVHVAKMSSITETLALMVISSAALGQRMSWNDESNTGLPPGYSISFQQALKAVSNSIFLRLLTPPWADGWTVSTRNMSTGFKEFKKYLRDMIAAHRNQGKLDQNMIGTSDIALAPTENLFNVMMSASEDDMAEAGKGLADEDVTGNAFLFLFAGHETTAHALAFSLGLLAVYPEVQQEVYAQVRSVMGSRKSLEYSDLSELKLVTGAFMESLRMYPVPQLSKNVERDIVLSVAQNNAGTDENDRVEMAVPAGANVIMSILATHYNPRYWPEPEEFRPARFSGTYNKDAFLAFGTGRRMCIGRRFAETEATAVIAMILARYEISIDSSKFATVPGETVQV